MPAAPCRGLTVLELLLALAVTAILAVIGHWGSAALLQRWQLWLAGHQLLEDLKMAQARAERGNGFTYRNGVLVVTRNFLTFESDARRYALFEWVDENGDGTPASGETRRLWLRELPTGVDFGWRGGINLKACSNSPGAPTAPVTFGTAGYPPCGGLPCLKFDQQGYSSIGPGGIYLTAGEGSLALTATRPGHFSMCRWDGSRWR